MGDKTKIEWATATWNPIDGCTPISEGCKHCYAANIARRFWGERKFYNVRFHRERLEHPLIWKKPKMIFVCSMGDLFHPKVKVADLNAIFSVIEESWAAGKGHVFMILTKRPARMKKYIEEHQYCETSIIYQETSNVWLGVTAENQKWGSERIPILLEIPAAKRFLSIEPMLKPIVMQHPWIYQPVSAIDYWQRIGYDDPNPSRGIPLDWVICGGETGAGAREMNPEWARSLRDQCRSAGVPFFSSRCQKKLPPPKT